MNREEKTECVRRNQKRGVSEYSLSRKERATRKAERKEKTEERRLKTHKRRKTEGRIYNTEESRERNEKETREK